MLKDFCNYINESKKRKNIFVFCIFSVLTLINLLFGLIPAIRNVSVSGSVIPVALQLTSYFILVLHIAVCIFCRVKHYSNILRGIFFYQLPAVIFFIIELGMRIAGSSNAYSISLKLFDLWTVFSRTFAYLITPFIGMEEIYTKLIIHIVLILITATSYSGIKKSIAFKEKIAEKHAMEAESSRKY